MPGLGHGNGVGVVLEMGKEPKMGVRRWGVGGKSRKGPSEGLAGRHRQGLPRRPQGRGLCAARVAAVQEGRAHPPVRRALWEVQRLHQDRAVPVSRPRRNTPLGPRPRHAQSLGQRHGAGDSPRGREHGAGNKGGAQQVNTAARSDAYSQCGCSTAPDVRFVIFPCSTCLKTSHPVRCGCSATTT